VRIAADEVRASSRVTGGITDSKELVIEFGHDVSQHDWTPSAELMAKVLAAKGYHYQFLFARNAKHVDRPTVAQTLPAALEWTWKGFPIP